MNDLSDFLPFVILPLMAWGVIRMLKKKNEFTPLKKLTLGIGLVAFFITEMVRSFWRPYVYKHDIFDYYFSDTIGNSFGTITAIFMLLSLVGKGKLNDWKLIVLIIFGLIIYEFLGYPSRFDINDVVATLIFGICSLMAYLYMVKVYR